MNKAPHSSVIPSAARDPAQTCVIDVCARDPSPSSRLGMTPPHYLLIVKVTVRSKIVSTGFPCSVPGANCHCCTASSAACSNSPELLLTTFASRMAPVRSMMHSTMTKPFKWAKTAGRGYGGETRLSTIGALTSPTPAVSGPVCSTSAAPAGGPSTPTLTGEPHGTPRGPVLSPVLVLCVSLLLLPA